MTTRARRMAAHEPAPRFSLTDELRGRIMNGALALGERLSDKALALEFGVSRTPVRESLLHLQSEGLLVIKPQSGTFVFNPADEELRQICAARAIMECGALRLLGAEAGPTWPETLQALIDEGAAALADSDADAFDELDCQFHETLVALTGNAHLIRAYGVVAAQLRALRQKMPRDKRRLEKAQDQHERVLRLARRDGVDAAVEELSRHVGNVARLLIRKGEDG